MVKWVEERYVLEGKAKVGRAGRGGGMACELERVRGSGKERERIVSGGRRIKSGGVKVG